MRRGDPSHMEMEQEGGNPWQWLLRLLRRRGRYRKLSMADPPEGRCRWQWRRSRTRRAKKVLKLGGGVSVDNEGQGRRRRHNWRLRMTPRLQLTWQWVSPGTILSRLRDSYVNLMLAASARITSPSMAIGSFNYPSAPSTRPFGNLAPKEYDNKILVELYKSLPQPHQPNINP